MNDSRTLAAQMNCKLCGTTTRLVKSHIIPQSFYAARGSGSSNKLLSNAHGARPKRSPTGIYDEIVCSQCEAECFGPPDDYAARLFFGDAWLPKKLTSTDGLVGFELARIDLPKLRLFALSVLWRSHASSHEVFRRVSLGRFEGPLRSLVYNKSPGNPDDFAVLFARFTDTPHVPVMDPHVDRFSGVRFYRFNMGVMQMYIKVDRRDTPSDLRPFTLASETLLVTAREFQGSSDFRAALAVAARNPRAFRTR